MGSYWLAAVGMGPSRDGERSSSTEHTPLAGMAGRCPIQRRLHYLLIKTHWKKHLSLLSLAFLPPRFRPNNLQWRAQKAGVGVCLVKRTGSLMRPRILSQSFISLRVNQ